MAAAGAPLRPRAALTRAPGLMHQTNAQGVAVNLAVPAQAQKKVGVAEAIFKVLCCFSGTETVVASQAGKVQGPLLPPAAPEDREKKCLVLDLDETLVHSSFKPIMNPDYVIPVEIEGQIHHVYVLKRPGVDTFLEKAGKDFEIVVFTASLAKYADPLLTLLDEKKVIKHRLFRESCTCHEGNYVKDLDILGRPIERTIIVDNSPMSYLFQPENAIGVSSFIDDLNDRELFYCLPFLESIVGADNVVNHLHNYSAFIADMARRQGHVQ